MRMRRRRDGGAATVLALGAIIACLTLLIGALEVAQAVATGHRAAAAADLAALAGAQEASAGADNVDSADDMACRAAARIAALNGATLVACVAGSGPTVTVWASVASTGPWPRRAIARSRAGPGGVNDATSETAP